MRTDETEPPLLWEPIDSDVDATGQLQTGGVYCLWLDLGVESLVIHHANREYSFQVEFAVVAPAVAIEAVTLSDIKALFD